MSQARMLNLAAAILFLVVGILATVNTIRLNTYIQETLPRDQAQERCNAETVKVLTTWLEVRRMRDAAMDRRDEAAIVVLDRLTTKAEVSESELRAWRDAVDHDRRVRAEADAKSPPLPRC